MVKASTERAYSSARSRLRGVNHYLVSEPGPEAPVQDTGDLG